MKFSFDVSKKWDGETFKLTILPKVEYRTVREAALFCQGQAILLCPVDSGRLRSSIGVKLRGQKVIEGTAKVPESEADDDIKDEPAEGAAHVGTNVDYAIFQEFGAQNMQAQPYLRPAADITEGKSVTICEQAGKQEFENYKGLK